MQQTIKVVYSEETLMYNKEEYRQVKNEEEGYWSIEKEDECDKIPLCI